MGPSEGEGVSPQVGGLCPPRPSLSEPSPSARAWVALGEAAGWA